MNVPLFRGKTYDNTARGYKSEWVCGGIVHQTDYYGDKVDHYYIIDGMTTEDNCIGYSFRVKPETIGSAIYGACYNLKHYPLYEGDIVIAYERHFDTEYSKPLFTAIAVDDMHIMREDGKLHYTQDIFQIKVIGNVHDNPDLINEQAVKQFTSRYCLKSYA